VLPIRVVGAAPALDVERHVAERDEPALIQAPTEAAAEAQNVLAGRDAILERAYSATAEEWVNGGVRWYDSWKRASQRQPPARSR
jgi:hypothetical protein